MSKALITESVLTSIANAIRTKLGVTTIYKPTEMATAIGQISGYPEPTGTITINQNGSVDVTNYATAVVDVSGGGGVQVLTQAQWDALTTAEKQAYGLVAIQQASSGFDRGILVYGADYVPAGYYLPNSDQSKVICEAYVDNFDASAGSWGVGSTPMTLMMGLIPSKDTSENAIYLPCNTNAPYCAYVDLGAQGMPFTAYVVMKMVNPGSYTRELSAFASRSGGSGIMLYGSTIHVSSWANDTSTGISAGSYFAAAIQFAGNGSAFGLVHGGGVITKAPSTAGRYVTIARTDPNSNSGNAEPGNALVRYMAVVNEAESQVTVAANLANLASEFIA